MKFATTILPPSLLLLLAPLAAADGGFFNECSQSWSIGYRSSQHFVVATCPGTAYPNATSVTSALSMGDCITNNEGSLEAQALGDMTSFCRNCRGVNGTAKMLCDCKESGGFYITSVIDLNTILENDNGILSCFGLPGFAIAAS